MQRFFKTSKNKLFSSSSTSSFSSTTSASMKPTNRLVTPLTAASALTVLAGLAYSLSGETAHAAEAGLPITPYSTPSLVPQTKRKKQKKKKSEPRPTLYDPGQFSKMDREAQENLRVDTFGGVKLGVQKMISFSDVPDPDPVKLFQGVGTMSIGDPQKEGGISTDIVFFSKLGKGMLQGVANLEHQSILGFFKAPISKVKEGASITGQFQHAREFVMNMEVDIPARERHFHIGFQQNFAIFQLSYAQALTETLSAGVQLSHAPLMKTFYDAALRYRPARSLQSLDKEVVTVGYSDLNQGQISASYFRSPAENVQLATEFTLNKNNFATGFRVGAAVFGRTYQYRCSMDQDLKFSTLLEQSFNPMVTLGASTEYHAPSRELQLGLSITFQP